MKNKEKKYNFAPQKEKRDDLSRPGPHGPGEESPDREGRFAGESPDGSDLVDAVTENDRQRWQG